MLLQFKSSKKSDSHTPDSSEMKDGLKEILWKTRIAWLFITQLQSCFFINAYSVLSLRAESLFGQYLYDECC